MVEGTPHLSVVSWSYFHNARCRAHQTQGRDRHLCYHGCPTATGDGGGTGSQGQSARHIQQYAISWYAWIGSQGAA